MTQVTGMKELTSNLNNFVYDMDKAIDDAVRITALKVQVEAVKSIRQPSHGMLVKRRTAEGNMYTHMASKEGESPNTDTGELVGSITTDHHKGQKVAYVGTNVDHGFYLETVLNRPWLEPSKMAQVKDFGNNMKSAINMQIKAAGK